MQTETMWTSLRRAVRETEGFFLRLSDDASRVQSVLLFFQHGLVALLVMIGKDAELTPRQIAYIERFRDYCIPIYYAGSNGGIYNAVVAAAQNYDLGINNCYP